MLREGVLVRAHHVCRGAPDASCATATDVFVRYPFSVPSVGGLLGCLGPHAFWYGLVVLTGSFRE